MFFRVLLVFRVFRASLVSFISFSPLRKIRVSAGGSFWSSFIALVMLFIWSVSVVFCGLVGWGGR